MVAVAGAVVHVVATVILERYVIVVIVVAVIDAFPEYSAGVDLFDAWRNGYGCVWGGG